MARKGRRKSELGIYHVILRGNDGLFFEKKDYYRFLEILKRYVDNKEVLLYALSMEKNKIHMVIKAAQDIGPVLKPICTSYARFVNGEYEKSGKLFYDRYMSEPIDDEGLIFEYAEFVNKIQKHYGEKELSRACKDIVFSGDTQKGKSSRERYCCFYMDNYADLTDDEIKERVLTFNGVSEDLEKEEKKELVKKTCLWSNLSKSRMNRIFGLTSERENKKESIEKTEKREEEIKTPRKKELSVWLL